MDIPFLAVWLSLIALTLIVLIILYFKGYFRPDVIYRLRNVPSPESPDFALAVASLSDSFLTQGNAKQFWLQADEIFAARLDAISSAKELIQFETFFFTPGRRSKDFKDAIIERANAGVCVQLIVDANGSSAMPKDYWQEMRSAGVEVRFFSPFYWSSPLDYLARTHRKLLLIDRQFALVGGAGISDFWDGEEPAKAQAPWYDFEVKFEGESIRWLEGAFLQHWLDVGGEVDLPEVTPTPHCENPYPMLITSGEDPTVKDSAIRAFTLTLIHSARKRLWFSSPYLLPDRNTCRALHLARQRGVEVRILTMGPLSDKPFVYYTSREAYPRLLSAGIEIYEYQPSMMHGKVILVDDAWVSVGSANLDPRSFYHNDELNLSIPQPELIRHVEQFFYNGFAQSRPIDLKTLRKRSLYQKVMGRLGYLVKWHL